MVIEVDGFSHNDEQAIKNDNIRDKNLLELGFVTLRFSSWEVLKRIDDVSIMIGDWIRDNAKVPPPSPRQRQK